MHGQHSEKGMTLFDLAEDTTGFNQIFLAF
jgi:hypothetical protein